MNHALTRFRESIEEFIMNWMAEVYPIPPAKKLNLVREVRPMTKPEDGILGMTFRMDEKTLAAMASLKAPQGPTPRQIAQNATMNAFAYMKKRSEKVRHSCAFGVTGHIGADYKCLVCAICDFNVDITGHYAEHFSFSEGLQFMLDEHNNLERHAGYTFIELITELANMDQNSDYARLVQDRFPIAKRLHMVITGQF